MCHQYISKERVKTRLKRRYGWLYAIAFALILNLAVAGASRSYHLMEVRQDQTGKSVTLTSRIPRLSGLKDSSEQAKRNIEFQEESKKALVWTQMYRAKTGAQTASADQYYEVSFADENCLSIVFQTNFSASGANAQWKQGHTIRLSDGKPLLFSDLFEQDSGYQRVVEKMIQQALQDPSFQLSPRQSYYLTQQDLVVLVGSVSNFSQKEVALARDQLQGYLKQEF